MNSGAPDGIAPLPRGRSARIGGLRVGYEVRAYFRQTDTLFFTFLFPVLMLAIFATAFSSQSFGPPGATISAAAYYLPGMLAAGILLSGLQNLGVDIAVERADGTLKRYAGSPMPIGSYFMGKMGQVAVTASLQAAVLIVVAWAVWKVELPSTAQAWGTFAWVFVLGVSCSAVLGIAVSAVPRSGKSAQSVIVPIALVLQFISGVYIAFDVLPEWMQQIASVFPLRWTAAGMRAVFLPTDFESAEPGGTWALPLVAIVCTAWLVVGLIVCALTFRWNPKDR
ncbi:ABC transporter permease [uncultured Microbacterium sp.]|uniref:ABC transporter permease n=1 Tax=uncultured Microbacterium sp. TaxID=191216 RepID=UPI0035C9EFBA